jgi:hypothetical protein
LYHRSLLCSVDMRNKKGRCAIPLRKRAAARMMREPCSRHGPPYTAVYVSRPMYIVVVTS